MRMLLAGRERPGWELAVPRMRTWRVVCCLEVPGRCHPGVPSAELLLGNDTWDGLGPLPTWKLLSMVMRLVWKSFYGNVLSPGGCRSWTQCHLWVSSSSGSPMIPCSVTILGSPSHQTIPAGVICNITKLQTAIHSPDKGFGLAQMAGLSFREKGLLSLSGWEPRQVLPHCAALSLSHQWRGAQGCPAPTDL